MENQSQQIPNCHIRFAPKAVIGVRRSIPLWTIADNDVTIVGSNTLGLRFIRAIDALNHNSDRSVLCETTVANQGPPREKADR